MGYLSRVHETLAEPRFTTQRRAEERVLTRANVPAVMLSSLPTASGVTVTPENALQIADAYACVRALADAAASLPLIPYRRTSGGRARMDGRIGELLTQPAPAVSQANLVGQIVAHLNLHGNAFVGKYRNGEETVQQLGLLPPDRITVELKGGMPLYSLRDDKGQERTFTDSDIVHIKALSTDGLVGLSPVRQAREALGLSSRLTEHAARTFENDARPSGILTVPSGPAQQDAIDNIKTAWEARHRGAANAHRIAVLSGDVNFAAVGLPLEDLQFLEQRKLSATEIARVFRVPPWIVGADSGSSMTYSNTEQQSLHFATYSLRPWLVLIEQALSNDTDLFRAGTYCEFLLDALLRADSATRADVYTKALDPLTGWMSREEVRRLENLDPEPDSRMRESNGRIPELELTP